MVAPSCQIGFTIFRNRKVILYIGYFNYTSGIYLQVFLFSLGLNNDLILDSSPTHPQLVFLPVLDIVWGYDLVYSKACHKTNDSF